MARMTRKMMKTLLERKKAKSMVGQKKGSPARKTFAEKRVRDKEKFNKKIQKFMRRTAKKSNRGA